MKYTIYLYRLEELKKAYNRLSKKAQAIGLQTEMQIGEPYTKAVNYYRFDEIRREYIKDGKRIIEVVDIDLNYPDYKIGNYELIAIIDHTLSSKENAIYSYNDKIKIPLKYRTAPAHCEHCKTTRKRNNTALLKDASGDLKQVGIDCLKEYTGIKEAEIIRAFVALESLFEEVNTEKGYYTGGAAEHITTLDYIAECIHIIHKEGYTKSLKAEAFEAVQKQQIEATAQDRETAQKVIDYFKAGTFENEFLHNVHMAMMKGATRENGFLAYAYKAYQKEIEKAEKAAARKAENAAASAYYGKIGDKIQIPVKGRVITSYQVQISYYNFVTTYIYEFRDNENHVFIWRTQKEIPLVDGIYTGTISGTIKEHNEYNGTKQTIITRCKA